LQDTQRVIITINPVTDIDGDGIPNSTDNCPSVANADQINSDGDSAGDACDSCPNDPNKADPGICGCGVPDTDTDSDGVRDCVDICPETPVGETVNAEGCSDSQLNQPPIADAGTDRNVITGSVVTLVGSNSYDPDGKPQPLTYQWSFISVPQATALTDNDIANRTNAIASFIPDVDGDYVIKLVVSDSDLISEDTVQIIATIPNVPPNANAGTDITIYLGQTAILNGSLSNDPDNGPQALSYLWSFVSVPAGSQLNNDSIAGPPSFVPDVAGTYVLELMVSDGQDVAFDNVAVTVVVAIPDIYVSPTSLNFGTVSVGSSVTKYLSVKNEGDGSLNISYSLNNPSLPVVLADNCGGSLSAGASCNISVTYILSSLRKSIY
jgi:hypothetical protein